MSKLIRIYLDKIFIIKHIGLKNKKAKNQSGKLPSQEVGRITEREANKLSERRGKGI